MTFQPEIHWHEGMFLRPHQLQHLVRQIQENQSYFRRLSGPGFWGFSRLELDLGRIGTGDVNVLAAEAVFKDGSVFVYPGGNGVVEPRKFKDAFQRASPSLPVYLAIPKRLPQRAVIGGETARYGVEELGLLDENTQDPNSLKPIQVRRVRGRILFGDETTQNRVGWRESADGFETLKLGDIVRDAGDPAALHRLSRESVPPILDITVWEPLRSSLTDLCGLFEATNQALANQFPSPEIARGFVSGKESDSFLKLHATNTFMSILRSLCLTPGVHPFQAFLGLCQAAGHLAYFGQERRCVTLKPYDHDELGLCFGKVIEVVRELLGRAVPRDYDERTFEATVDRFVWQAEFDPKWMNGDYALFVGVIRKSTDRERLDPGPVSVDISRMVKTRLKLAAARDRETVFKSIIPGITLTPEHRPPATMPWNEDEHYFRLDEQETIKVPYSGTDRWEALRRADAICIGWNDDPPAWATIKIYAAKVR